MIADPGLELRREPRGDVYGDRSVQQHGTLQQCAQHHGQLLVHGHRVCVLLLEQIENRGNVEIRVDGNLITTLNEYNSAHALSAELREPGLCLRASHGAVQVCGSVRELWDGGCHHDPEPNQVR